MHPIVAEQIALDRVRRFEQEAEQARIRAVARQTASRPGTVRARAADLLVGLAARLDPPSVAHHHALVQR